MGCCISAISSKKDDSTSKPTPKPIEVVKPHAKSSFATPKDDQVENKNPNKRRQF